MTEEEEQRIRAELTRLHQEHGDLEAAIAGIVGLPQYDPIRIHRLKKKKLAIKDRIAQLEDMLLPDIIA